MIKIFFDFTLTLIGLTLLSPFLFIISILVFFSLGNPILFMQCRPGLNGIPFSFFKFRTMKTEIDEDGKLLSDEKRLTKFGEFLRKTSLDEFPSLWNVLKGEMSLVGPRPLLIEYLPLYSEEQARRHDVRPGITGWAQVNGRNSISWEEKFELDVWYVNNQSLWLDIKILWLTLIKVIAREGITFPSDVIITKFTGTMREREK